MTTGVASGTSRNDVGSVPYRDFEYPRFSAQGGGGSWEPSPQTFHVEELQRYPFCGTGEHAALIVRKEGLTTRDVAIGVARRLGLPASSVGYAGMKDKQSVSVQAFTVTGVSEEAAGRAFEEEGCRVLSASRHRNKLRLGHLEGNRFEVYLEGADPEIIRSILARLSGSGCPNYYGPQRFGARGDNARQGLLLLRGRGRASRWKRDLLVSSLQSFVFNEVLARRIEAGTLTTAAEGDVLRRQDSGGLFLCVDPGADTRRIDAWEVSPTGPIWGRKMLAADAEVGAAEARVLADLGLAEDLFQQATGTRRPLRAKVEHVSQEETGTGVWVRFACPAGTYATSVVRELLGRRS